MLLESNANSTALFKSLNGVYRSELRNDVVATIDGNRVTWADNKPCGRITQQGCTVTLVKEGDILEGYAPNDRIFWPDGSVWIKDERSCRDSSMSCRTIPENASSACRSTIKEQIQRDSMFNQVRECGSLSQKLDTCAEQRKAQIFCQALKLLLGSKYEGPEWHLPAPPPGVSAEEDNALREEAVQAAECVMKAAIPSFAFGSRTSASQLLGPPAPVLDTASPETFRSSETEPSHGPGCAPVLSGGRPLVRSPNPCAPPSPTHDNAHIRRPPDLRSSAVSRTTCARRESRNDPTPLARSFHANGVSVSYNGVPIDTRLHGTGSAPHAVSGRPIHSAQGSSSYPVPPGEQGMAWSHSVPTMDSCSHGSSGFPVSGTSPTERAYWEAQGALFRPPIGAEMPQYQSAATPSQPYTPNGQPLMNPFPSQPGSAPYGGDTYVSPRFGDGPISTPSSIHAAEGAHAPYAVSYTPAFYHATAPDQFPATGHVAANFTPAYQVDGGMERTVRFGAEYSTATQDMRIHTPAGNHLPSCPMSPEYPSRWRR